MPVPSGPSALADRKTLRQIAVDRIKDAILDGTLLAGEVLSDADLQAWLGFSRTPIREALRELHTMGLVETQAQSYTRVASPDPSQRTYVLQALGAALGGVVRVSVPVLSPEQQARLMDLASTVRRATEREHRLEHERSWAVLTLELLDVCPNPFLVSAGRAAFDALTFHVALTRSATVMNWQRLHDAYSAFEDALANLDPIRCELAIENAFELAVVAGQGAACSMSAFAHC